MPTQPVTNSVPVQTCEVEVWVCVDGGGDSAVGTSEEEALQAYEDNVGGMPAGLRLVKVLLTVPLPQPVVMTGTVPAETSEGASLRVS